jgi:hypothetical protein
VNDSGRKTASAGRDLAGRTGEEYLALSRQEHSTDTANVSEWCPSGLHLGKRAHSIRRYSDGLEDAFNVEIYKHGKKSLAKLYGQNDEEFEIGGRAVRRTTAIDIATEEREEQSKRAFDVFSRDNHGFAVGAPVHGLRVGVVICELR